MKFTSTVANVILRKIVANASGLVWPLYLSLHSADPGTTGANEIQTSPFIGYSRQGFDDIVFTVSGPTAFNSTAIEYDSESYFKVTHVGAFDLASGGNFYFGQELAQPIWFFPGRTQRFSVGALRFSMPGGVSNYLAGKLLDKLLNGVNWTAPDVHASLHTADPGITGANESSLARVQLSNANWEATGAFTGDAFDLEYTAEVRFSGTYTGFELPSTGVGIWDAGSGGNFLMRGQVNSFVIGNNQDVFTTSNLIMRLNQAP